jgi:Domain of unknown function (DUF4124)
MKVEDAVPMTLKTFCATLAFAILMTVAAKAETWRWTDSAGVVHFADDHDKIPASYRQKATVVDESAPLNIVPAARTPVKAVAEPAASAEGRAVEAGRVNGVGKAKKGKKGSHAKTGKKKVKQVLKTPGPPTTPARDAQNRAEERVRQDRQTIDDAQLPARRAQDQAEEQIRKAREKTMGH